MRIEKRRAMPIDRRIFVIKLDVAGPEIWMIGVLMEAKHQVPPWFDPVDAIIFVVNAGRVPEANLQSCSLRVVGVTQERGRINIRDDVPRSSSRRAIPHVLTPSLPRQPIVNVAKKGSLCIAVAAGKKDHSV
ncbi:hypothetical protein C492_07120 [Natronococcus jeotgali DSM 18795]|uniref:Uncharacterized protein n=1 Tax=Natronococcus jeotgali DSM 18795 TaxID=1227498 RepID=L9XPD8_9EURY|nr:hypothetical protein [Natronococcus jeotgali]ELY63392.1 hypothetical protein C492_07120 [Natronococcus jeotgali DSM 18795]